MSFTYQAKDMMKKYLVRIAEVKIVLIPPL